MSHRLPERDKPWMMRTYAGHSTAAKSNELYRSNLAKGQTGLSIAFDLPTQTGYDPDDELARGEVGKVGVPVAHTRRHGDAAGRHPARPDEHVDDDQRDGGVAAGALHRHRRGPRASTQAQLSGTTQNDIIKEFLARGTYAFPPGAVDAADRGHDRLHGRARPEVEPDQHLQLPPAGGGRDAGPGDRVRDEQRDRGARRGPRARAGGPHEPRSSGGSRSSSTPACASSRSTRSCARWAILWEELGRERYGVTDEKALRLRYGVQVNSLGLTESPAGEQRPADRARGARRHARPQRARPRDPAAGVERGARAAAAVGSAVVAAHPAGARATRPTCSSTRTSSRARR